MVYVSDFRDRAGERLDDLSADNLPYTDMVTPILVDLLPNLPHCLKSEVKAFHDLDKSADRSGCW